MIPLPEFEAVVFSGGLHFEAVKSDGLWWSSARISWDEMRNIEVEGTTLRGEASEPTSGGNVWAPFTLDLTTGQFEGGTYPDAMRRAMTIMSPWANQG